VHRGEYRFEDPRMPSYIRIAEAAGRFMKSQWSVGQSGKQAIDNGGTLASQSSAISAKAIDRDNVRSIVEAITDDQSKATGEQRLTPAKLRVIISALDEQRKVELLFMVERVCGRWRTDQFYDDGSQLEVTYYRGGGREKRHVFDWSVDPLRELRDYGFAGRTTLVRKVFLTTIGELSVTEKLDLFDGIDLTSYSTS